MQAVGLTYGTILIFNINYKTDIMNVIIHAVQKGSKQVPLKKVKTNNSFKWLNCVKIVYISTVGVKSLSSAHCKVCFRKIHYLRSVFRSKTT